MRIYLSSRQVTAFTRFCTLCHLNLNLISRYQISFCHTESAGCDLLHARILICSETLFLFSTFTGIRSST